MKRNSTIRRSLPALLAVLLCLLAGCAGKEGQTVSSLEQLNHPGRKIGVASDTAEDRLVAQELPQAQIEYFSDDMAAYTSVQQGKIDAFVLNRLTLESAIHNGLEGVHLLNETLGEGNVGAVALSPVTKIPDLEEKINTFLREIKSDGTLEDVAQRWLVRHEETMPEIPIPERADVRLTVGTTGLNMPFTYYAGTELAGYDIELARRFAAWLGASLEFKVYDYEGIVAAAQGGDVDCIFANLFVTPERQEAVRFSEPTYVGEIGVMVRDGVVAEEGPAGEAPAVEETAYRSLEDFSGKRIGVATGTLFPDIVHAALPDAELLYLNTTADMVNALKSGKIDAFAVDEPAARNIQAEDSTLTEFPELLDSASYAFILTKNERGELLCAELNEYLRTLWDDGTMEALQAKWFDNADLTSVESTDYRSLPATNGTIRLVTQQYPPFIHSVEGVYSGYEIEILAMFCRDCGYALEIEEANFDGILASVQSGKADIGCSSITVTEERKEVMLFSEPDYSGGTALLVLKGGQAAPAGSFLDSVAESFEKTFLRENRWQLFLEGIGTTLLITVLSILFGTLLGFGVFMLCRNGNPVANGVTRFFVWLVRGMPVVVLLMILYYIIFGNVSISGTAVSIVGFTLVFGAGVYGIIKAGVGAIDHGQMEAAYALGYSNRRAFFRVILPQALPHFMPAYKSSITEIIKATAIVGYVAVQDLTKMGDIIRSRTYDAFFPLIAVAVIYFILAAILTFLVKRIELRLDPRQRKPEKVRKEVEGR